VLGYVLGDIAHLFDEHRPDLYIHILLMIGIFLQVVSFILMLFLAKRKYNHYKLVSTRIMDADILRPSTDIIVNLKHEEIISSEKS